MSDSKSAAAPQAPQNEKIVHFGPNPFQEFWDKGYRRLIPIIPPNAAVSPDSHLARRIAAGGDPRGKAPGVRWPDGHWSGFNWVQCEADERDLLRWSGMGSGVGFKCGRPHEHAPTDKWLVAIDADLTNEEQARAFAKLVDRRWPGCATRVGRYPKALYPVLTDPDFPYTRITVGPQAEHGGDRIEILSEGKQFVAAGRHPKTKGPYQWVRPLPPIAQLPYAPHAELLALLEEARGLFPDCSGVEKERGLNESATNQDSLLAPSLDVLAGAVKATVNTTETFPTRESYRDYGYAVKASAKPEDWPEAFEIWADWCSRWTGGVNEADVIAGDWARMKPPFRRGWTWVAELAERHSNGAWRYASVWFEEPPAEDESIFGDRVFGDPEALAKAREATAPLAHVSASSLVGVDPPPQEWLIEGLIPARQVTSLGGDGGNGKSLLALQLAVAKATGSTWLGRGSGKSERVIFLTAEDELEELSRRLRAIDTYRAEGEPSAYSENLRLISLDGEDAVLASAGRKDGLLSTTSVYKRLWAALEDFPPNLLVLDTLADLFGGDEINRVHARQFIGFLRKIIKQFNCTILLLYHPSVNGMANRTGSAGNTAWNNSVRSRLYLDRVFSDDKRQNEIDRDLRILTTKKANRAQAGGETKIRYLHGRYVLEAPHQKSEGVKQRERECEIAFMTCLEKTIASGRRVAPQSQTKDYFAPLFFKRNFTEETEAWPENELQNAMNRLLAAGRIRVGVTPGPISKQLSRLEIVGVAAGVEADEALFG